jgi:hypothetical protein
MLDWNTKRQLEYEYGKECAQLVKDLMENTTKLSIALKAPPEIAKNWRDGH